MAVCKLTGALALVALNACAKSPPSDRAVQTRSPPMAGNGAGSAEHAGRPPAPPPAEPTPTAEAVAEKPLASRCGPLECATFTSARAALEVVLSSEPLVLAVGEAHAPAAAGKQRSGARRFAEDLLPVLAGRSSDLIVELMNPPAGCKKQTEAVREQHKPVTDKQSTTLQNDYVALGEAARRLNVVPDLLRPSCADLAAVEAAGNDAVPMTLALIARLTIAQSRATLEKRQSESKAPRMLILYGGAMHNDLAPEKGRDEWSFGPALSSSVADRYVELDVFVREYVRDTDAWKRLPWYPHWKRDAHPDLAELFRVGPRSFTLILPRDPASTNPN